ncbi:MAG TPA: hypothetical protein VGN00_29790 [Puia sp.]|jgi:hypothetical protein
MNKIIFSSILLFLGLSAGLSAQTVSFNFSRIAQPVTNWVNVHGDPSVAVCTGTSSGITVSSVAIGNWLQYSSSCSFDGGGAANGTFFPAAVMLNHWYSFGGAFNAATPQLLLSGLNKDSVYTIKMTGSFSQSIGFFELNPIRFMVAGATTYPSVDVNGDFNTSSGAVFQNVSPDASGNIKVYLNPFGSSNLASICGIQITTGHTGVLASSWSTAGNVATGDASFVGTIDTNRLNFRTNNIERMTISKDGNVTIGGKDTSGHPAMRIYRNGDLTLGTTMDKSVNTSAQSGLRYNAKNGVLQVGASDRLDTSIVTNGGLSGIIINTDAANSLKGRMMNTLFVGDDNTQDTLNFIWNNLIATESTHFGGIVGLTILGGYGTNITAAVSNSIISGNANQITKPLDISIINGFVNTTMDTATGSLVAGALNQFGGASQLVSGQYLVNRTPLGTTLGNSNVDFATLPYTGKRQVNVPNLGQYPLLALGNGANATGTVRSNALTVLFNGRTQINTTGHTTTLTQANATPAAALDVVSTNTGVLLPRLTNAQRNAIVAGDLKNGLLLYNTDSSLFQYYNGSSWNSVGAGGSGSSGRWLFSTGTNGTVYDNDDNIAIGTNDAKGYRLAVKGSALFTKVQVVAASNWPDYVFKKDYRLKKLEDLASYIDKYHHLPEIVSAAKVGKEGIDLGANQAAILKKVEELTLYLIGENRRLSAQNGQLEGQGKKITELETQLAEQNALFRQQQRQIDELKALIQKK